MSSQSSHRLDLENQMSESIEYLQEPTEAQTGREDRLKNANALLRAIANCGRGFFKHKKRYARFVFNNQYRVFFEDDYTQKQIYTHRKGYWKGFSHGGTLKSLIEHLRDYIKDGKKLNPRIFGPWPEHLCGGDLWGYGEDMKQVRQTAKRLEIT